MVTTLIDIDECLTGAHNCVRSGPNRAECVNEPGGFRCSCIDGYELDPVTFNQCDGMLNYCTLIVATRVCSL